MPDPTPTPNQNNNNPQPAPGNDPKPPDTSGNTQPNQNNNNNQNDKGEMIPKWRFDETNQKLKELADWKAKQEADARAKEEEDLKKKGEFETLAQKHEAEAREAKSALQTERLNNKITVEAAKLGVTDLDAATKLIDRSKIVIDKDGNITGLVEAVQALVESRPYLKTGVPQPNVGGNTNPPAGGDNRTPRFKHSQLQDAKFYQEHASEIAEALKLGLVEDDLAVK